MSYTPERAGRQTLFVFFTLMVAVFGAALAWAVAMDRRRPPATMSIRRCEDFMEARRRMTDIQLRNRWPGGATSPVQWDVRVIQIRTRYEGPGGIDVHFGCPGSDESKMAGTFYTTAEALGHRGGLDINRGDIITIRGNLHRNIEGWGASLGDLEIVDPH